MERRRSTAAPWSWARSQRGDSPGRVVQIAYIYIGYYRLLKDSAYNTLQDPVDELKTAKHGERGTRLNRTSRPGVRWCVVLMNEMSSPNSHENLYLQQPASPYSIIS